ncbi:MAG: AlbA family DNA-binding domain-containing protein [Candidatus Syntropharchaeia archaeon]
MCAFANSEGGVMYIGIDKSGTPIGVKNPEKLLEYLPNKIRDFSP